MTASLLYRDQHGRRVQVRRVGKANGLPLFDVEILTDDGVPVEFVPNVRGETALSILAHKRSWTRVGSLNPVGSVADLWQFRLSAKQLLAKQRMEEWLDRNDVFVPWKLDHAAIRAAIVELGIKRQVKVKVRTRLRDINGRPLRRSIRGQTGFRPENWEDDADCLRAEYERKVAAGEIDSLESACHWADRLPGHHEIHMRSDLGLHEASKVLWHELAHCQQREQKGVFSTNIAYSMIEEQTGYDLHPMEAEADEVSAEKFRTQPLVRPVG